MKICLVDNTLLKNKVKEYFINKDHHVIEVTNEVEIFTFINDIYDLYVINFNIKLKFDKYKLISKIRSADSNTPIVIINGEDSLSSLKKSYESGCNEYIKGKFFPFEFDLRLKQILNLNKRLSEIYFEKDFYYNKNRKVFYYKDQAILLTKKEIKFCEILIKNINRITPFDTINYYVWDDEPLRDTFPLRGLVSKLRKKLPVHIVKSCSGQGYLIMKNKNLD